MDAFQFSKSEKIDAVIQQWVKAGRKSLVYKKADHVTGNSRVVEPGLELIAKALNKFNEQLPFKIWIADIDSKHYGRKLLFYAKTENDVLALFNGLVPKKQVTTPQSVLVKMTIKRVVGLIQHIKYHNGLYRSESDYRYKPKDYKLMILEDINSLESLNKMYEIVKKDYPHCDAIRRIDELKKKPLNDEIIKTAWNLIIIENIHNK